MQGTFVFEQTRDTRVLSLPLSTRPLSPFVSSWNNRRCVFTSLPLLRLSTLPILSVSFLPPLFPSFFLCIVSQWWTPPSPPDPSSWGPGGLKCHSFSSCARFHAPKEYHPLPFFLSIFSSLSSSIYLPCSPALSSTE